MLIIDSTAQMEEYCKEKLVMWYERNYPSVRISEENVFTVWLSKTLQNIKCIVSTNKLDGIMAEYTYNGDSHVMYEDVYKKLTNRVIES